MLGSSDLVLKLGDRNWNPPKLPYHFEHPSLCLWTKHSSEDLGFSANIILIVKLKPVCSTNTLLIPR